MSKASKEFWDGALPPKMRTLGYWCRAALFAVLAFTATDAWGLPFWPATIGVYVEWRVLEGVLG